MRLKQLTQNLIDGMLRQHGQVAQAAIDLDDNVNEHEYEEAVVDAANDHDDEIDDNRMSD